MQDSQQGGLGYPRCAVEILQRRDGVCAQRVEHLEPAFQGSDGLRLRHGKIPSRTARRCQITIPRCGNQRSIWWNAPFLLMERKVSPGATQAFFPRLDEG